MNRALRRLASGHALRARLQAMIDGVAHEVQERLTQRLDDHAVGLDFLAGDNETRLLADILCHIAHDARQGFGEFAQRSLTQAARRAAEPP